MVGAMASGRERADHSRSHGEVEDQGLSVVARVRGRTLELAPGGSDLSCTQNT